MATVSGHDNHKNLRKQNNAEKSNFKQKVLTGINRIIGGKYKVVPGYVLTRLGNGCFPEWERSADCFRAEQGEVKSGFGLRGL